MGEAVVKAARDRDLYLIWSSIVDAPVWVGNRAELLEHLWNEYRREHPNSMPISNSPDDRVTRADERGSSMLSPASYGWDDEAILVMEDSPDDGWYQIRRDRLVEYAEALLRDDEDGARALLECYHRFGEDDDA